MLQNTLYTIEELSQEGNKHTVSVKIDPEHQIFKGHFPGQPVLPGVCLMEMVREVLAHIKQHPILLTQAQNIKFLKVVDPREDAILKMELEIVEKDSLLHVMVTSLLGDGNPNFKMKATYSSEN